MFLDFRRTLVWSTVTLLLSSTAVMLSAVPAAAAACVSARSNYFDGFITSGSPSVPLEGTRANLRLRGGYVLCTSDTNAGTNFSTTWVMVQGNWQASHYAQAGVMYRWGYSSCPKYWAEYNKGDGFHDSYLGGCAPQDGTIHTFTVQPHWTGSEWVAQMYAAGSLVATTPWDMFANMKKPLQSFSSEETTYSDSDVAGSSSLPEYYSGMEIERSSHGS